MFNKQQQQQRASRLHAIETMRSNIPQCFRCHGKYIAQSQMLNRKCSIAAYSVDGKAGGHRMEPTSPPCLRASHDGRVGHVVPLDAVLLIRRQEIVVEPQGVETFVDEGRDAIVVASERVGAIEGNLVPRNKGKSDRRVHIGPEYVRYKHIAFQRALSRHAPCPGAANVSRCLT